MSSKTQSKKVSVSDLIIILDEVSGIYSHDNIKRLKEIYKIIIEMSRINCKYKFEEVEEYETIKLGIKIISHGKTLESSKALESNTSNTSKSLE